MVLEGSCPPVSEMIRSIIAWCICRSRCQTRPVGPMWRLDEESADYEMRVQRVAARLSQPDEPTAPEQIAEKRESWRQDAASA